MNNIVKEVRNEIERLEGVLEKIEKFSRQAPEGSLKCQKRGKCNFFYHQTWNEKEQKWDRKYIKKKHFPLIRGLAQKRYFEELEPVLRKNLEILKDFFGRYKPAELEKVYDKLHEVRKMLVKPAFVSREEILRQWLTEEYEENNAHPEYKRFTTEQGEVVRSKSEALIANLLYSHRDELLYKYERPLELKVHGRIRVLHPDFTILNVKTGRVVYWEHVGLLDKPEYANDFVWKMNAFANNGFKLGKDVVASYETEEEPLDMVLIRRMVEELCRG